MSLQNICEYLTSEYIILPLGSLLILYASLTWMRWNFYIPDFDSKCVFITGCDSGFGLDLARRLDRLGCTVFAGCYTKRGEERLRGGGGGRLHALALDVTSTQSIRQAYAYVEKHLPKDRGKILQALFDFEKNFFFSKSKKKNFNKIYIYIFNLV